MGALLLITFLLYRSLLKTGNLLDMYVDYFMGTEVGGLTEDGGLMV